MILKEKKNKKKYEKILKNILKNKIDEPFNFYLTYRGIKKSYYGGGKLKELKKILKLSKDLKLNCFYKKTKYNKKKYPILFYYKFIISKKKIPKNILNSEEAKNYYTKNFAKKIGKIIGYPSTCIGTFATKKNKYRHSFKIVYKMKNDKKTKKEYNVYYFMCNKSLDSHMKKMKKNIEKEFKNNLSNLFSYYSINYEINKIIFN